MTTTALTLGCIFLASGRSRRMGRNKLLIPWQGVPLITGLLRQWPNELFSQSLVVARQGALSELASRQGFPVVAGDEEDNRQNRSIALGLAALRPDLDGCLFSVCDQPFLSPCTVKKLVQVFDANRQSIVASCWKGRRGNPVIFPADLLKQLASLKNDQTGRFVIEANVHRLRLVEVEREEELFDLDSPDDLSRFRSLTGQAEPSLQRQPLWSALDLSPEAPLTVALVGGGGKTTMLWTLARQAREAGASVIVTTSTHMRPLTALPVIEGSAEADIAEELAQRGIVQVGFLTKEGKLEGSPASLQFCRSIADVILVEADGSRGLPLKVPASHEPQIPLESNGVIVLAGIDSLGVPLSQICHRASLAAALLNCSVETPVSKAMMATLLTHREGGRKGVPAQAEFRVVINKKDLNLQAAEQLVQLLIQKGVKALSTSFVLKERDGQCWY